MLLCHADDDSAVHSLLARLHTLVEGDEGIFGQPENDEGIVEQPEVKESILKQPARASQEPDMPSQLLVRSRGCCL